MNEIARRVIRVTPDQVIGPPRKKRNRKPTRDPMLGAWWTGPEVYLTPWAPVSPNAPTQQGFGHLDKIAREMKA